MDGADAGEVTAADDDRSAALARPAPAVVVVLFAAFGVAAFSSQCLQAIYPSELFPTGVRATANGFATGISRVGAAIGTWGAPVVLDHSTRLAMLLGAVICVIGWGTSYVLAPETSGLTLADASSADADYTRGRARTSRDASSTTPSPAVKEPS